MGSEGGGAPRRVLEPEAHILLVEDDGEMRHLIARFLGENGFRVTGARDGREMWEALEGGGAAPVDLLLLDVMLPGRSGFDLCRGVRSRRGPALPILMLTARGEESDRVLGLELGADDYIPKPFGRRELLARIRAALRRAQAPRAPDEVAGRGSRLLAFAGWVLDTGRRELLSPSGTVVDLSGGEYDMLLALAEHPQRVLSRDQLLELARNRLSDAFDRSVDVQISRLRRKIEPDEASPAIIKTVRGAGYMFVPAVERR
jgi:two-component system OmpR family response regulator